MIRRLVIIACGKTLILCLPKKRLAKIAKTLPLKKIGRPQDVANAVLFLASNKVAGHITGQVLSVSGGYSMV